MTLLNDAAFVRERRIYVAGNRINGKIRQHMDELATRV